MKRKPKFTTAEHIDQAGKLNFIRAILNGSLKEVSARYGTTGAATKRLKASLLNLDAAISKLDDEFYKYARSGERSLYYKHSAE
jgi:hypothetical protein